MRALRVLGIAVLALTFLSSAGVAAELDSEYRQTIMGYFGVSQEVLDDVCDTGVSQEDIPVVLLVAKKTGMRPTNVAKVRAQGDTWVDIAMLRHLKPVDFYMIVTGHIESDTYAAIMKKFSVANTDDWGTVGLTDADIVNLVNAKVISSGNDYSLYETMVKRDSGQDFAQINRQIHALKQDLLRAEKEAQKQSRRQPVRAGM